MLHKLLEHTDGKLYISADAAALMCGTTRVAMLNWRKQDNPPPYNSEINMYPVADLGVWIRTELPRYAEHGSIALRPDTPLDRGARRADQPAAAFEDTLPDLVRHLLRCAVAETKRHTAPAVTYGVRRDGGRSASESGTGPDRSRYSVGISSAPQVEDV